MRVDKEIARGEEDSFGSRFVGLVARFGRFGYNLSKIVSPNAYTEINLSRN